MHTISFQTQQASQRFIGKQDSQTITLMEVGADIGKSINSKHNNVRWFLFDALKLTMIVTSISHQQQQTYWSS